MTAVTLLSNSAAEHSRPVTFTAYLSLGTSHSCIITASIRRARSKLHSKKLSAAERFSRLVVATVRLEPESQSRLPLPPATKLLSLQTTIGAMVAKKVNQKRQHAPLVHYERANIARVHL